MLTEMQVAVSMSDWSYINNFLHNKTQGNLRRVMYAATLCDNVEVAEHCIKQGLLLEKATIALALQEGALYIADYLYGTAVQRKYTNILEKCDHVISNSFLTDTRAISGGMWLAEKGYVFEYTELLGLIATHNLKRFKITFRKDFKSHYDVEKIVKNCVDYKSYEILYFLQQRLSVDVRDEGYSSWKQANMMDDDYDSSGEEE
jgi:hypothetical protein